MGKSFKLRNGLLLLSTEAPGGVYNTSQLKKIAALCEGDSAIAKATEDQRLAIFAPPEKAAQIAKELRSVGLGVRHYQDGLHQPVNCIGELCGEHQQDAMGASMDLARSLGGIVLTAAPLKIGINGCGRCCVPTHTLDISVIGEAQGYRLSLGGRNAQLPELATYLAEGIPPGELPDLLTKVVNLYKNLAQSGETLQDVLERCGSRPFLEALAPYSQDGFGADSLDMGDAQAGADLKYESRDLESAELLTEDVEEAQADLDTEAEAPNSEYEEISEEEIESSVTAPQRASSPSESRSAPPKTSKAPAAAQPSAPMADPQHGLMDGLPGFDPSLEGGETVSGPTIDDIDLVGDGHGSIAMEPELLGDDLLQDDSIPLLDDHADVRRSAGSQQGQVIQEDFAQDLTVPEGPIAPVEDDFDAQQALSDDFEDQTLDVPSHESATSQGDVDIAAVAGLDPIEDIDIPVDAPLANTAPENGPKKSSPVEVTPAETAASESGFEAEKDAEEVDGSDADALEAKLAASIAAEESIVPVEDENAAARMEAMNLIAGESLPDANSVESVLDAPEDFSDLQIDAEPVMEPELLDAPDIDAEDFELEEFPEAREGDSGAGTLPMAGEDDVLAEDEPASKPQIPQSVTTAKPAGGPGLKAAPTPPTVKREIEDAPEGNGAALDQETSKGPSPKPAQPQAPARKDPGRTSGAAGFSLSGIDLIEDGRVSLAFASGMSLVVDPRSIAPGMTKGFNFGGQRINITAADQGLNVEVDGVTIFLPVAA